ncbi:hypothetical protein [Specibacter sp. NPDC078692]|uniref:hypothetical protein n=1 Tax=Specibacter sp. NPDC078692 TaxID=3155818 RepID=UPI00342C78CD
MALFSVPLVSDEAGTGQTAANNGRQRDKIAARLIDTQMQRTTPIDFAHMSTKQGTRIE